MKMYNYMNILLGTFQGLGRAQISEDERLSFFGYLINTSL